jgi:hypothetical protein
VALWFPDVMRTLEPYIGSLTQTIRLLYIKEVTKNTLSYRIVAREIRSELAVLRSLLSKGGKVFRGAF